VISDCHCCLHPSVWASSDKSIEAVHGDKFLTPTATGTGPVSTAGTVEGQLLSARLWPGLHWVCYQTVWVYRGRPDKVKYFIFIIVYYCKLDLLLHFITWQMCSHIDFI
jgi:hypothetical protein